MIKHNQDGYVNALLVPFILCVVLLLGAIGFGAWAFAGRQDYKTNTDQKVAAAVVVAKQQESSAKDKAFAEAEKNPLKTYNGPEAYGSIQLSYPKTWSGYVDDDGSGGELVNGYFYPGVVPSVSGDKNLFALRVKVINQSYSEVLNAFSSQQQNGKLTVSAYALPKVPKTVGVLLNGSLDGDNRTGTMVVLPMRDKTLEISTDGAQFVSDFNNIILPNFSFSP